MSTALDTLRSLRLASLDRLCRETGLDRRTVRMELAGNPEVTWFNPELVAIESVVEYDQGK